ncbi:MAG: polysaccharide deacetylase family protein [Bacteroidales bacterium]|nr:polysaccharide deacetylase family protein [Bacteroidales bacterium]
MFTFRNLTILFFILLFSLNVIHFIGCRLDWLDGHLCSHVYVYMVILLGLYIGISVGMAFLIGSNFHHPAICDGKTDEMICSLTFDDGPDPVRTAEILTILKREKIPATFFVIGKKLEGNETLIREMDADGHLIGNHSWSHSVWFDFFRGKRIRHELEETGKAVYACIGKTPLLFRPPFGVINPTISKAIDRLSLHAIGWNVRSYDTVQHDAKKTAARVLNKISPGSIILLHDHPANSPELVEEIISGLNGLGYKIVPITQLADINAYA